MLVLIDNYDSFTYNLVHFLGELGAKCEVFRNDQITVAGVLSKRTSEPRTRSSGRSLIRIPSSPR